MRTSWSDRIESLDPKADFHEIFSLHFAHEFPWDSIQALSFALFRTYAVPSIGSLLDRTGEFTDHVQKRYDDTSLLLDQVVESGFHDPDGLAAIRRINQMHGAYAISNDDMRYVLATFVVVPTRWLAKFGWRPVGPVEQAGMIEYYRTLGRHLGITDIPTDYDGFVELLEAYEAEHFARDPGGRRVADATIDLLATFPPYRFLPRAVVRRLSYALMDTPLLDAFGYPHPTRAEVLVAESGLKLRARALRFLPVRRSPFRTRTMRGIRSYPGGYAVGALGVFPRGCPVDRAGTKPVSQNSSIQTGRSR